MYGEGVETLVEDEDTQPIEQPIIQPLKITKWDLLEPEIPQTKYTKQYMIEMMDHPSLVRNVAIAGHLSHGKTSFMDMLVQSTHTHYEGVHLDQPMRYTDTRIDEQQRALSIKSTPMSLLLHDTRDKHFLVNVMDTPGHVNFSDEVTAAFRISDGVVLVVDALEGVMVQTERIIQHAIQERLPMVLLINKVDRLILELKLPPNDAYYKLKHTLADVNNLIEKHTLSGETPQYMIPQEGNVCFASSTNGWCFNLPSFAKIYADYSDIGMDHLRFAKRLWGDVFYHASSRRFFKKPASGDTNPRRSFVEFVLEPLYKIYSHILGSATDEELAESMRHIGVRLRKRHLMFDTKPLIQHIFNSFFSAHPKGFVDMVSQFIPAPNRGGNAVKVQHCYTGPQDSEVAKEMIACDPHGTLMIYITKLYHKPDCSRFDAFGRIMSGTVKKGSTVRVLFETFTENDEEEMTDADVTSLYVYNGRYRIELNKASAGSWVLLEGVDDSILKTATITSTTNRSPHIFRPLTFNTKSVIKIAVEPLNPSDLPKMIEGLRKISKSYPLLTTKVEESGEYIVLGTGELYLDAAMHDLRKMYADIEIKIADPVVSLCETVAEASSIQCYAETANKQNKLTMICEQLDKNMADDIESNRIKLHQWDRATKNKFFQDRYGWDGLAVNSLWAFGPGDNGPNALLNETFPHEVNPQLLSTVRDSIVQGFNWGTREGPLCDEPIRNCKFRLLNADISDKPLFRGGGQIIPAARRVVYSSFLMATPRLMEPVYEVQVICPLDAISAITKVLERRRGNIVQDVPKPGTPLFIIRAFVPVIDSFGLETDIRSHTQGQIGRASCRERVL